MSAFSFTAPRFTDEDSIREQEELPAAERERIEDECFGRNFVVIEETPELIETALCEIIIHLQGIACKPAYDEAMRLVPHLVEQESAPIRFLRCERFCAARAAKRLVKYWEMRLMLFEEKAFLPMRLDGALQGDIETMAIVPDLHFITGKDEHGRLILFGNKARLDFHRYSRRSVNRCVWYHIHINTVNDVEAQKRGMVGVGFFRINSPKQFDRINLKWYIALLQEALPIKLVCWHICHTPEFFKVVFPMMKFMMGKELRLHSKIHHGAEGSVLADLARYGVQRHNILKCMGGTFDLNINDWINERRRIEVFLPAL